MSKETGDKGKHVPYVSSDSNLAEFTVRALVIGLIMCVVLGAANAYLGLKAGMTIAATYPAAVIGMAILRLMKGSILEENFARTVGSIGESVAAGAIFTIPAFVIAQVWDNFATPGHYFQSAAIMMAGGILGIMFVAMIRRVMVEDQELPFPESVAAGEIHKAGQKGGTGAKFLFWAMGSGALIQCLGKLKLFPTHDMCPSLCETFVPFKETTVGLQATGSAATKGGIVLSSPGVSPAYMGVGYIIGPKLASLNFSGGLLAWGLFVPILLYFMGPNLPNIQNLAVGAAQDAVAEKALEIKKAEIDAKVKAIKQEDVDALAKVVIEKDIETRAKVLIQKDLEKKVDEILKKGDALTKDIEAKAKVDIQKEIDAQAAKLVAEDIELKANALVAQSKLLEKALNRKQSMTAEEARAQATKAALSLDAAKKKAAQTVISLDKAMQVYAKEEAAKQALAFSDAQKEAAKAPMALSCAQKQARKELAQKVEDDVVAQASVIVEEYIRTESASYAAAHNVPVESARQTIEKAIVDEANAHAWSTASTHIWKFIIRPIAIGGMLISACFTLFRMRKSLKTGIKRSIGDVKKAAQGGEVTSRIDRDISFPKIILGIFLAGVATFFIYYYFAQDIVAAFVATVVMVVAGFFFAAVSGYLVGTIGSSNNPISGLTLSTLLIAALLMVLLGMGGTTGVAAVLGVAAVVCVSSAVAGEMLQDLKVGHILGGTPHKMQMGDIIGVILASLVMFLPLVVLHQGDINAGGTGFGGRALPAPQASLMAMLSQGIVGGKMAWALIVVGVLMGLSLIFMQVKSPMLICVGMYLPLETTFAIFLGGIIKGAVDMMTAKKGFNDAQKARVENTGVLLASGLIAGEALIGLLFAGLAFGDVKYYEFFHNPPFVLSLLVFLVIGWMLVRIPVKNAGSADEPAPPVAVM